MNNQQANAWEAVFECILALEEQRLFKHLSAQGKSGHEAVIAVIRELSAESSPSKKITGQIVAAEALDTRYHVTLSIPRELLPKGVTISDFWNVSTIEDTP